MKITCFIFAFIISMVGYAQREADVENKLYRNSILLGILETGSFASVSYERRLPVNPNFFVAPSVGLGFNQEGYLFDFTLVEDPLIYATIPHRITACLGSGKHFLEIGVGATYIEAKNRESNYFGYQTIGYRFQSAPSGRAVFRLILSYPVGGYKSTDVYYFPLGVSFGQAF